MRRIALLMLLFGAGCSHSPGAQLRNPDTGELATECGPLRGLANAVAEARQGCIEAYEDKGWSRVAPQRSSN